MHMFGPRMPVSMAIWPDAVSGSMLAMKNGLTARAPLVSQVSRLSIISFGPPPPEPKIDADVVAVVVGDLEAGVGQRLLGGRDAEDDVAVGPADLLEVHPGVRIEVVDLAGDLAVVGRRVPARDPLEAGDAR